MKIGDNMTLGRKLKQLRIQRKLNQEDVAKQLNISTGAYGLYEQDRRSPNHEMLKLLAQFYNVSIDELLDNKIIGNANEKKTLLKNILKKSGTSIMFSSGTTVDDLDDKVIDALLEELAEFLDVKLAKKRKRK